MYLLSDYNRDVRTKKFKPGAYEWWYFDGIDSKGQYGFTIIFYEGNPFSTRYISRQNDVKNQNRVSAAEHPAVSISVYKDQTPIYYSFTEFEEGQCSFDESIPKLKIGNHEMRLERDSGNLVYLLELSEVLPSGDQIEGVITFRSPVTDSDLLNDAVQDDHKGHFWNLVQPRAKVDAKFSKLAGAGEERMVTFTGTGYHDHNMGNEPMRNEFSEWYWGRFHFDMGTLVYYIMNRSEQTRYRGWLIAPDNQKVLEKFQAADLQDRGWSLFGLKTARKIALSNDIAHVTIQQSHLLDNGPFYQRFNGDAFINIPQKDIMQAAQGITEYLRPDRIHWKIFWPLMNMRMQYLCKGPHWVQRSKTLYRWTW